jgi:hypothetical protein
VRALLSSSATGDMDSALHNFKGRKKVIGMGCGDLGCHSVGFYLSFRPSRGVWFRYGHVKLWDCKGLHIVGKLDCSRFPQAVEITTIATC